MDSFEVENFRSLKHLKLEKLTRVNLLVGKNNSGKTSVLEALFAISGIEDANWLSIIEKERGLINNEFDFRYIFYGFDSTLSVVLSAIHRDEKGESHTLRASMGIRKRLYAKEHDTTIHSRSSVLTRKPEANVLLISVVSPTTVKPIEISMGRDNNGHDLFIKTSIKSDKELAGLRFPGSSRYMVSEILTTNIDRLTLGQKLEDLKFNKIDAPLLDIMKIIDIRIEDISLSTSGQIYLDLGANFRTLLPLNLMGEGVQRLLDIAAAVAHSSGGIVLIDEIDNGLHYSALRILWKGILQAAREYDVQVFATTHSAEALRHLTWVLDNEENADYRNDVAAYTLIRADGDMVRTYRYDYEQLDYALDHGVEVRN
ncbi:AAA family ATPase [Hymenobacter psychrophilus]|nr:ATP-binding protein [Hymenobacter psychrophilus]